MCDDNCENLKPDRIRCESCRTINLAKQDKYPKPDMQIYNKCTPVQPCVPVSELPLAPTCIKVCNREEFKLRKSGKKPAIPKVPYGHGKMMYAVKAGLLVGAAYFTYSQGVWGDQREVTECIKRWQEYMRSINTRRPPTFDRCGNVVMKESTDSLIAPLYAIYKSVITTCFAGIVKFPVIVKCMYLDYLKAIEQQDEKAAKMRKIKKAGPK